MFTEAVAKVVAFRRQHEQGKDVAFLQEAERMASSRALLSSSMYSVVIADLLERQLGDVADVRAAHREATRVRHNGRAMAFEDAIAARCQEVVAELSIVSAMLSSVVARHLWRRCRLVALTLHALLLAIVASGCCWLLWLYFFGDERSSS